MIALRFLKQVTYLIRANMQYYIIYWLSGQLYFFIILANYNTKDRYDKLRK